LKTIHKFDFKKQEIDSFIISKDIIKFQTHFASHKNLRLFGVPVIVPENEYVVYIKFHCPFKRTCNIISYGHTITESFLCNITYITNYGRFINKNFELYYGNGIKDTNEPNLTLNKDSITQTYYNNNQNYNFSDINVKPNPLTYRMPVIFIKILDAIHNENTELLQECFQEYHSRYIENKTLKEENKMILETIKQPYEEMKPKYEMLEKENKVIKEENARLKLELELLKIKMEETKKMYIK